MTTEPPPSDPGVVTPFDALPSPSTPCPNYGPPHGG